MRDPHVLRPFVPYYGSKWRIAPRYPKPAWFKIVEPFAGFAGYSLRYHYLDVTLYDKDPLIVGLWQYLLRVSSAEIRALPMLGPGDTVDDFGLCQEARWLIGFWANPGTAQPRKRMSKWALAKGGTYWGPRVRDRLAWQVGLVRHWRVELASYVDVPGTDDPWVTWFVDPPYEQAGVHYTHGSRGLDYGALGDWCRGLRGQVIVCEAEGASWLPFGAGFTTRTARNTLGREVVWLS